MAQSINISTVSGRCVAKPVEISDGKGVSFSIAAERSFRREGQTEWETVTDFIDVVVWGGTANLARKMNRGVYCTVTGRLSQQKWVDEATATNRSKIVLVANQVVGDFMFTKGDGAPEPQQDTAPAVDPVMQAKIDAAVADALAAKTAAAA